MSRFYPYSFFCNILLKYRSLCSGIDMHCNTAPSVLLVAALTLRPDPALHQTPHQSDSTSSFWAKNLCILQFWPKTCASSNFGQKSCASNNFSPIGFTSFSIAKAKELGWSVFFIKINPGEISSAHFFYAIAFLFLFF